MIPSFLKQSLGDGADAQDSCIPRKILLLHLTTQLSPPPLKSLYLGTDGSFNLINESWNHRKHIRFLIFFHALLFRQWFMAYSLSSVRKRAFFSLLTSYAYADSRGGEKADNATHFDSNSISLCSRSTFRTAEVLLLEVLGFSFLSFLKNVIASSTL